MNERGALPSWFQRLVLPGFAFKAVVIGGGYATGRELATFFLPSGPRGGLYAMGLSTIIWSSVCALTFVYAYQTGSKDYRTFFQHLLGPLWPVFEIAWVLALLVILAAYAAAAGAILEAVCGWPPALGSALMMAGIAVFTIRGNESVEGLFKYVTFFLYGTYLIFVVMTFSRFGSRSIAALTDGAPSGGWIEGGMTYAGYNIIGAVVILPTVRHFTGRRDALIAGVLAGPMAMLPACLFFICMLAFIPDIASSPLPADYMLRELGSPAFRVAFQLMILAALLESATGGVHAINERIAHSFQASGKVLSGVSRFVITCLILAFAVLIAARFGFVALIASGFKWLSYAFLLIYVAPLMSVGLWRVVRQ